MWLGSERFAFIRDGVLMVANADGSGERELANDVVMDDTQPCVAPDASRVAAALKFSQGSNTYSLGDLLVVDVDGAGPPQRIATGASPWPWGGPACSWQALWP
jgi:hypothetical protein